MNTFDEFPQDRRCQICGTADECPGVLVTDANEAVDGIARHAAHPAHPHRLIENDWYSPRPGVVIILPISKDTP